MSLLLQLVFVLVLAILAVLWRHRAPFHPTAIPFPDRWPVLGHLVPLLKFFPVQFDYCSDVINSHPGKMMQLCMPGAPVMLYHLNPAVVKHILKDNFDNYIISPRRQAVFSELFGKGIFGSNGEQWRVQRKSASHMFTQRNMRGFMADVFAEHCDQLVALLDSHAETGEAVDLQ
eukprot:CAMPEP_0205830414 /NCGR_PEP_ID=MMETSP0206-20130828/40990_1 /ASSEMBLY_ACC=CAM_ASM_000279 /TAXON_ID=36767 /ORGANISM="Euplotes focardii, Strain TN1" /LENGTH=173 /DNA_ID=CAMNT_0053134047 /DNA_START=24 /DNA_END=542 /DNA_ORIENTATION=+